MLRIANLSWANWEYYPSNNLQVPRKTTKKLQSEQSIIRPRFKPGTFKIQVSTLTATPPSSVRR